MSENTTQPQGKGLAVGGFVLSLVTLIGATWIAGIATLALITGGSAWLMYLWLVLSILSIVLSVMGMSKLGKSGGKKGLGIAGMIIGICATIYSIILVLGISAAASMTNKFSDELNNIDWQKELNDSNWEEVE
jgi:hypothetical protein